MTEYFELESSKAIPQHRFKKGFKNFGYEGYKATIKELKINLIGSNCIKVLNRNNTSKEISLKALSCLMFKKNKRTGKVKARGYIDRRPQREYITKEESRLPIVLIYALIACCVMDAI